MYIHVYWNIYTNRHIVYNRHEVLLLWYLHVSAVWLFTFLPIYLHNLQYLVVRHNICLRMYVFTPCYRIEPGKLEPKEPLNGSCSKRSQRKVAEFVRELIKIYQILKVNILHAVNLLQHEDILNHFRG